jgi:hypothetical protein
MIRDKNNERTMARTRSTFLASFLGRGLQNITALFSGVFNPYRPELHYMRGPGPKWHAARNRR